MDDTWQKLMGIDCASEEGPSSPIFHKKKWVVFPKPLKRSGSGTLLTKCPEKKQKNKMKIDSNNSLQILDLNNTILPEDKVLKNTAIAKEDPLLIYNTTPSKNNKQKRKTIDLLNCSSRTEVSSYKKSKLGDCPGLSSDIKLEKNLNELGPVTSTPSVKITSPKSKKKNLSQECINSKPQRKLLYSCNEEIDSSLKPQTLTVNDIVKSVIIIDEADIHSSPKKNRPTAFEVEANDFQSVTSLGSRNTKDSPKAGINLVPSPYISDGQKCNDSFGDLMFTEIENECLTTKEIYLESIDTKDPMTADSPASPVDTNPMDETFSNCRFTEIEEDYSHFNHKENDNHLVTLPEKSAVIAIKSSCLKPNNTSGKNTCFTSDNKNDSPIDELISHASDVTNKIVKDKSYFSLNNERNHVLSRENSMENSFLKSCSDEKDIFNSTFLSQKSFPKLETTLDKKHFLSTSKDCFDNLDIISTEEFRNNHLENHYELNVSVKEDVLNLSIENAENDVLNKSVSKLDVTLTDIMQRLLKKRDYNERKPILKNQSLDNRVTNNGNSSLIGLIPEITAEEETKNLDPCNQTLANISSSECIPETSGLLCPGETVFLTQEYLENVKSECSLDTSAVYYQQSFDYMISAEVKSRLSGYNCVVPLVDKEPSLLDQSLPTDSRMGDDNGRSPDDSFINNSYKHAKLNESNASDLNEFIYVENTVKSPTDTDFLDSSDNLFSQNEYISPNSVVNCSPKVFSDSKDLNQSNNVEIRSSKVLTSCMTDISSLNSDLMSQRCLQQFDHSFQLQSDDLASQKKEKNLNNDTIEELNVGDKSSHHSAFLSINTKKVNVSQECLRKDKSISKDFLDDTTLFTQNVDTMDDKICCEDGSLKMKNCVESVNLKNVLTEDKFINSHGINKYKEPDTKCSPETKCINEKPSSSLHLEMKNSVHCIANNDFLETVQSDGPVLSQKPFSPTAHQKSSPNYTLTTALGKNINVSGKSLEKIRSIFTDDLVVSNQDNVRECLTDSDITDLNVNSYQFKVNEKNQTEFPLRFNMVDKNIDVCKSGFGNLKKTDINQTFKSPIPRPKNVDNLMFSSAGGKKIEVSEKALAKVKPMFNKILDSDMNENKAGIRQEPKFSSPNEKNTNLPDDGLLKVRSNFTEVSENQQLRNRNIEEKRDVNHKPKSPLPSSSKFDNFMFSNAGGKNIKASDDSLAKVKLKFEEASESCPSEVKKTDDNLASKPCLMNNSFTFSTAGGKNIKVSNDALAKVKSKYSELMESQGVEEKKETYMNTAPKKCLLSSRKNDNFLFSTAGGKNIKVSCDALAKVKSNLSEIMDSHETDAVKNKADTNVNNAPEKCLPSSSKNDNFMFSTAGGINIKVSDAALAKVKSKFSDIMDSNDTEAVKNKADTHMNTAPKEHVYSSSKNDNFMFSTTCGKNIKVSNDAVVKVKSKFMEIDETEDTKYNTKIDIIKLHKKGLPSSSKNDNFMFSTAGGKNIKVSDAALAKVKSKFNEIMETHETEDAKHKAETDMSNTLKKCLLGSSKASDFMTLTASGNNFKVLEESSVFDETNSNKILEKHQATLDKDTEDKTDSNLESKTSLSKLNPSVNFKIPRAIGISPKVNSTRTEADINKMFKMSSPDPRANDNFMFSTAGRKNIRVSDIALANIKSLFKEILESDLAEELKIEAESNTNQVSDTSLPSSSKNDNFMFSSANGKNIKISEDALAKVKSKFGEIFEDSLTDLNIPETETKNQAYKTSLPSSSKNDNFMFSTAGGKNIKISNTALAKVKSKFNEIIESHDDKSDTNIEQLQNTFLPHSDLCDNFMFSSANGKSVTVSENALAKVRSKFTDILEESPSTEGKTLREITPTAAGSDMKVSNVALAEGKTNEIEVNERQLLETSFSYFDKLDSFSIMNESKNIEISNAVLDDMKSKLSGTSNDDSTNIDTLVRKNTHESFHSSPKINEIKHENTPDKYSGIKFSTARGKHISVSEDVLLKVRSKFSEVIDSRAVDSLETEKSDDYAFLCANSPNKNLSVQKCLDPVSEKTRTNKIEGCFSQIPYDKTPSQNINKLSISYKNDKKSKSSHSENSTSDQPLTKKICFQPGIIKKTSSNISEQNIPKQSKIPFLAFTQSISQSLIDNEVDIIEKKIPREDPNSSVNDLNLKRDECLESKDVESSRCDDQFSTEDSDLTMIYEVSDSAAAFMADCTPGRSVLSSPSSFFNRKSMKPVKLLEMEFEDVDDEIMTAAELDIIPKTDLKNPLSNDFTKNSLDRINFRSCSGEVLSIRSDQEKRVDGIINQKLKKRPSFSPGLYMTLRNEGNLKRFSENLQPFLDKGQLLQLGLKEEILCISSNNAGTYEFCADSFFSYEDCFSTKGIIDVGYGFSLILSDDNKIGLSEISRCFLLNPSVDPSLVSSDWIKNHFKWIVWKLACYERAFPRHLANRCLTPENILHQLKYRYDREIYLTQRSALKKILECDEPSSRRLIACVSDIQNVDSSEGESNYEIELTDGWYSIWACIDSAMKTLIDKQKVKIGMKLIIQAAELSNCTEGCDPLQITSSIRLKLHTNSVRRVKWDSKMGFTRHPGPMQVSLSSILKNGGLVGLTSAIIARVYPLLYMSKDANGKTVFRNAYAEHHASNLKENDLTLKSEELFEKLFPEVEAKYKKGAIKFDKNIITKINDPELLWKIVSNESDPSEVQSLMTPDQLLKVQKFHELISSKIREEVQALVKKKLEELIPSQKPKCLLKVRLVDPIGSCNALLTVWNPSEDLLQLLVEKKYFDFYALNACGLRDKVIQLSNTNRTIYQEKSVLKSSEEFERKVTPIHDIVFNSATVQFGELDVIGTVIFVKEPEKPWGVTNVYLSDVQESFLMITFWTSLKTFGCDDALKPGSTVACINLQWRQGSGSYVVPSTYANEMTYFCTNPKQEYLIKPFKEIKSSISTKGLENFIIERRRKLLSILKEREYSSKTPVSRVETPKVLKRLENLKKYGDASPLPKLSLLSSPDIHRKFRSPKSGSS